MGSAGHMGCRTQKFTVWPRSLLLRADAVSGRQQVRHKLEPRKRSKQKISKHKARSTKMSQSSNVQKLLVIQAHKATCSMRQVSEGKMYLTMSKMYVACEVLLKKVLGPCTAPNLVNNRNLIGGQIKSIDIGCPALSLSILKPLTLEEVFPEISRTFAHRRSTRHCLVRDS